VLRPRLVGRDTQMHDLFIFFGTIGGLLLFGVLGFIVGPILAALFVTVWDIYGIAFRDFLPKPRTEG
jgi:predicted PurR-regulated permease PerM